jgi:transketolase
LGHHAGISLGYYGTSHHATEDIGIMRSIANLKIICPADAYSLEQALRQTVEVEGPIYFRLGRGREADAYQEGEPWEYGKVSVLRKGSDGVLFANGIMVTAARQAAATLAKETRAGAWLLRLPMHWWITASTASNSCALAFRQMNTRPLPRPITSINITGWMRLAWPTVCAKR